MTMSPDESRETRPSLILRVRNAADTEAWATFVETYAPLVYRYCRRQGLQDCDASDMTQEVMAQVARSVRAFDYRPERGKFRNWLGTVARSRLANYVRSGRRPAQAQGGEWLDELASEDPGPAWAEEFDLQVLRTALARIEAHFEPTTWRAFELVWLEHRPAADAAQALGIPIEIVYVAKSRVLKRLREEVVTLMDDLPLYIPLG